MYMILLKSSMLDDFTPSKLADRRIFGGVRGEFEGRT